MCAAHPKSITAAGKIEVTSGRTLSNSGISRTQNEHDDHFTTAPRRPGRRAATAHAEPSLTSLVDTRPNVGNAPLNKRELMGPGTLNDRNPAWTPTAIKKFLGEPDKLVRNPVYRNAPQMRMFLTERVEEIEATDEWKTWEDGHLRRSAANGRKKPEEEKIAPKVELGHGRNGFYPVLRR